MIYLDYSATTPINLEVLNSINKTYKNYLGNANSINKLGKDALELFNASKLQISNILNSKVDELYFTSSATEANNIALIGVAMGNHRRGKHIITSKLEHSSIYEICKYLETVGFKISYVNNNDEGLIDFDHLKELITEDTILVSVCSVNSELGIRQPLKMIRQIIKKQNPHTYFHSDMTQALGKINISILDVDLASFSSHKIYGPSGIGLLYKNNLVKINPILYGGGKLNNLNPGTPPLPLIVGFSKAIRLVTENLEQKNIYVEKLNKRIANDLSQFENVLINQTKYSIPQILNISVLNIMPETMLRSLEKHKIYLSTNSACSSLEESTSVKAVYRDLLRSRHTLRISLSSLTTLDEVNRFLKYFNEEYNKLNIK